MNKITLPTLLILVLCFFSGQLNAQDGYTYTMLDNGSYSYTIAVVPNASASNFATSVQSYGFTIIVPDGVTATVTSSLGSGAGATFFNGTDIAQPTLDGYLITETLGSPASLPAPSAGTTSPIVTIQVNGSPTSGFMYILANNSAIATAITPLKAFMQADMIDDGSTAFTNVVDPNALGLSGNSGVNFATLSTPTAELTDVSVYPNPTTNKLNITGVADITSVAITNMNGQLVLSPTSNLESIDMSSLQSGLYFVNVQTKDAQKTIKVVKQ